MRKPAIEIKRTLGWIEIARDVAAAAGWEIQATPNQTDWRRVAVMCRRAQRLLGRAKWQAEANAVRLANRRKSR